MPKTPASYRLSSQALNNLATIQMLSGCNATAIVELALAWYLACLRAGTTPTQAEQPKPYVEKG